MSYTTNERRLLSLLLEDARSTDVEISKKLRISPQAVGKIRRKLEEEGVIQGYTTRLDYKKLGINVFAVALFRIQPEKWTHITEKDLRSRVRGPHIINFYRLTEGDVTHIVLYGFRSLEDLDQYFHILQTERGHISQIRRLYVFSSDSLVKESPKELFAKILDEWGHEKPPRPHRPLDDAD
ncbi:MAG: winged helix-turn-helix transcriptional regulator [Candidatus Altiarchaeales archaeon]|nr:winged helix-turn-helix transcriptional regulator [Candidatus Altiarchaeales archaeon]